MSKRQEFVLFWQSSQPPSLSVTQRSGNALASYHWYIFAVEGVGGCKVVDGSWRINSSLMLSQQEQTYLTHSTGEKYLIQRKKHIVNINPNWHLCKISSGCFLIYETTSWVLLSLRVGVENKSLETEGWRRANDISWKWETVTVIKIFYSCVNFNTTLNFMTLK